MGEGASPLVVADAGPLIHLYEIGRLPLLRIFSAVYIPQAVWEESVTRGRVSATESESAAAIQQHQVTPEQIANITAVPTAAALQKGEQECLALCLALDVRLLLTDDLAAREASKVMSIRPVGSLGVIVRAYDQGRISLPEAEDAVEKLYSVSTLFVTRAIADLAIEQLRQPFP